MTRRRLGRSSIHARPGLRWCVEPLGRLLRLVLLVLVVVVRVVGNLLTVLMHRRAAVVQTWNIAVGLTRGRSSRVVFVCSSSSNSSVCC